MYKYKYAGSSGINQSADKRAATAAGIFTIDGGARLARTVGEITTLARE